MMIFEQRCMWWGRAWHQNKLKLVGMPAHLVCIAHSTSWVAEGCVSQGPLPVWREDFNFTLYQKGPDSHFLMQMDRGHAEGLHDWGSTPAVYLIPRSRNFLHGSSVPRVYKVHSDTGKQRRRSAILCRMDRQMKDVLSFLPARLLLCVCKRCLCATSIPLGTGPSSICNMKWFI